MAIERPRICGSRSAARMRVYQHLEKPVNHILFRVWPVRSEKAQLCRKAGILLTHLTVEEQGFIARVQGPCHRELHPTKKNGQAREDQTGNRFAVA